MYPRQFEYQKVTSVAEAVEALQADEDAKILAGGHSLLPVMKLRLASPTKLIDIAGIEELKQLEVNGSATIGAGVTYNTILGNDAIKSSFPVLYEAVTKLGDVQVRNRGTVGGSAAHSDPAADTPAALLALGAEFTAVGPNGERTITADDFFVDLLTTALEPDEVLTKITLPNAAPKSAYEKFAHPASGYAVCGVAAVLGDDGVRLAVSGATYKAVRLTAVEDALSGGVTAESIDAAVEQVGDQDWAGDHFASAEYRAHLTKVLAKRALKRAAGIE